MKQPAIQFYTGDWFKDVELSLCGPATRGIWTDLVFRMHDRDRCGQLVGTREGLARLGRCTVPELDAALAEISATKSGVVTEHHGEITITNRRMRRDWEERQEAAKRAKNYRNRQRDVGTTEESRKSNAVHHAENHAEVTSYSSSSSSSSSSEEIERDAHAREPGPMPAPPGPSQPDIARAGRVAALYPATSPKFNRAISFNLYAQNLLAAKIAAHPEYPWEEHAQLLHHNPTPLDGHNWVEDMPNPIALEKLRKAAPAPKQRNML